MRFGRPVVALCLMLASLDGALARESGRPRPLTDIVAIVVHTVGGPICVGGTVRFTPVPKREDDAKFWQKRLRASPVTDAHFVIGRSGKLEAVIPIDQVANHTHGLNQQSIGIELVNGGDGHEPFPPVQIASLIRLIRDLRQKLPTIPIENIVTHSEIDQRTCTCGGKPFHRRQDPGPAFPLDKVRAAVTLPGEKPRVSNTLIRLTGVAAAEACPTPPASAAPSAPAH